jgi:hypothetical protein
VPLLRLHVGKSGCVAAAVELSFVFGMDSKVYIVIYYITILVICSNIDILYNCRTQIQKVKKMIDMPLILLATIWASFTGYAVWYVTSAKRNVAITFDDAKTLWEIHKKNAKCAGRKWRSISRRGGKISGFECECGYKYNQKRPIVSSMPKNNHRDNRNQTAFPVTPY